MPERSQLTRRSIVQLPQRHSANGVLDALAPSDREQVEAALAEAYEAGARDADERSSRFVARCVAALVGLPMPDGRPSARAALGRLRAWMGSTG